MYLTGRKRRAISSRNTLTDQEKRQKIKEWDLDVWTEFTGNLKAHKDIKNAHWCSCPNCKKGNKQGSHNLTGLIYEHRNGDGMGFKCFACKAKHPRVYEYLGKGSARAEGYAWRRFEIDAVGKGWYCPYPQRWKEISELAGKRRAEQYKADYERKRREHKVAYDLRNNAQAYSE